MAVAVVVRMFVFAAAIAWPIPDEGGLPVSPLAEPAYLDFDFYVMSLHEYATSLGAFATRLLAFYLDGSAFRPDALANVAASGPGELVLAGPVFPLLLAATGYAYGHSLPLAIGYLVLGSAIALGWLRWLDGRGVGPHWLYLFAIVPNPIWFMLVVSPDLLFAGEFAAFYLAYFAAPTRWRRGVWVTAFVLMALTRPNAVSVSLFVAIDICVDLWRERRFAPARIAGAATAAILPSLFWFPDFLYELSLAGSTLTYFGHTPAHYFQGVFTALPRWLDLPLSWLCLVAAKAAYFTGLRPSYGVTPFALVAARGAAGLVLLPGLLYVLVRGAWRDRVLIGVYVLPVLLLASQDRYDLPILPILFLYGHAAIRAWRRLGVPRAA